MAAAMAMLVRKIELPRLPRRTSVCLQELKAPDDRFPAAALRAVGYGAVWHGQKSWNGVAICSPAAPSQSRIAAAAMRQVRWT